MGWFGQPKEDPIKTFSDRILDVSQACATGIRDMLNDGNFVADKDFGDQEFVSLLFQFAYFYIQVTDRIAATKYNMDMEKRSKLMMELGKLTASYYVDTIYEGGSKEVMRQIKKDCFENFLDSIARFGPCTRMVAREGEEKKDTLLWEFCKEIAKTVGAESDIVLIVRCEELITADGMLYHLDINSFLEII